MKLKKIVATLVLIGVSPLVLAGFTISDIRVEGLQHTEMRTVLGYLPIKTGDTFVEEHSEEIIQRLYATGFFDDVRVETVGTRVLLTVTERPIIGSIDISGAKMLQSEAIKKHFDALGLVRARPFNRAVFNGALAGLRQEYIIRGKRMVKITPTVNELAHNRVAVEIKIEEGKTAKIVQIEFEGNTQYSDSVLRRQMLLSTTGPISWLTKDDHFDEQKFNQDLERITNFYQNNGYFEARVLDTDVQTSEDGIKQHIHIKVHEGSRYRWGNVRIEGDTREVAKEDLYKMLTIKEGKYYERQKMIDYLQAIQKTMGSAGYAFSNIDVRPIPNPEAGIVDIVLVVNAGRKVYVNEINISGNSRTRDKVIRRELRQMEAAPYDASKLQRSKERIELLGYFDNVQIKPNPVPHTPDQVDLDILVKERHTGSLNLSAGWVQGTGLILSGSVAQDNLFGTGKSVSARLARSKTEKSAALSFTEPYFTPDGVSLGYNLYGKTYDPTKVSRQQYKTTTVGAAVRTGVPITEYDRIHLGVSTEYMGVDIYDGAPERYREFIQEHGSLNKSCSDSGSICGTFKGWMYKGNVGWGRNTTDNAIWPTRGYIANVNGEIVLPGSKLQYYTLTHKQTWFFPLNKYFTLRLGGEINYGNGYGKTEEIPFFENFYGGGLGSVRGFANGTLGPKVKGSSGEVISNGGNKKANFNAELLFPMPGIKDTRSVRLSLFADAGSVWDDKVYDDTSSRIRDFLPQNPYGLGNSHHSTFKNELRYSVGAAITWLSPVGPLKFSYAFPFKKHDSDEIEKFQFQLGTTF